MIPQINKSVVYSTFGEFYGNKLIGWLNPCSPSFCKAVNACNASSPFNIAVDIQCNPKGGIIATFSITYNINIAGITNVQYFISTTDPTIAPTVVPAKFATEILNGITAGTTYTATFTANNGNAGTQYVIATDNRGNYSNVVAVVVPSC